MGLQTQILEIGLFRSCSEFRELEMDLVRVRRQASGTNPIKVEGRLENLCFESG